MKARANAIAIAAAAPASALARDETASQEDLLAVLRSDAGLEAKADACRQLERVGDRDAVEALAGLLSDERLSHRARSALERIDDPAVDAALRDAAGRLEGRRLVGALLSIGARGDAGAVEVVRGRLDESDVETAAAAAYALGRIGTPEAAQAIETKLKAGADDSLRSALQDAALRCAEGLATSGRRDLARGVYEQLRDDEAAPAVVREAAARGLARISP